MGNEARSSTRRSKDNIVRRSKENRYVHDD
jgi:hypothetical protein